MAVRLGVGLRDPTAAGRRDRRKAAGLRDSRGGVLRPHRGGSLHQTRDALLQLEELLGEAPGGRQPLV